MQVVPSPETFWLGFDKETEVTALQLEQQLGKRRLQRRGFGRMIKEFDQQGVQLRNTILLMERSKRQRMKAKQGGKRLAQESRILRLLRRRLHAMQRISGTLQLIHKGKARPLSAQPHAPLNMQRVQTLALDATMALLHRVTNPNQQSAQSKELGCFADIPLSSARFVALAHAAYRVALAQKHPEPLRFVDVGCGGGMKVLLASEFFDRAEGFDYDPAYVAAAQQVLGPTVGGGCKVFQGNALTFETYADYDIIYFYQPMQDTDALEAMERRISQNARPGTILIAPYLRFVRRAEALNCSRIAEAVYVAGVPQSEADRLRKEAERMGPQVARQSGRFRPLGVEWMQKLAIACAANGYTVP
jgi:SAM-dependent methyltransferase